MCYVEHNDAVVLTCWFPRRACAVKLSDSSPLWEFNQQINGRYIKPCGLCHDTDGRIYMVDYPCGVISLDSRTGELLQHLIKDVKYCRDIFWTNTRPQLTVLHGVGQEISTFNICGF